MTVVKDGLGLKMFGLKKENNEKLTEKDKGFNEDAISVLLNLVHAELHSINNFFKTKDVQWLEINNELRKERTELLDLITIKEDSEIYCFNKHILTVILGYVELGNRKYSVDKEEAIKYFEKAKKWLGVVYVKNKL